MKTNIYPQFLVLLCALLFLFSCRAEKAQTQPSNQADSQNDAPKIIAKSFAYPLGGGILTSARDKKDEWFDAQNFGENNHLGEDWNKNSGGNTDCGEKVFAVADGRIVYAENAGPGWGNVVIIEHHLPDGTRVQSLYGHLQKILKPLGEIKKREQIGTIGNADGRYLCHLHLEIRTEECPMWNKPGGGYSAERKGWLDPSEFIDARQQ